jgi:hypothetical protein
MQKTQNFIFGTFFRLTHWTMKASQQMASAQHSESTSSSKPLGPSLVADPTQYDSESPLSICSTQSITEDGSKTNSPFVVNMDVSFKCYNFLHFFSEWSRRCVVQLAGDRCKQQEGDPFKVQVSAEVFLRSSQ